MKCKHHWKDHEHIMVEYSKSSKTIVDDKVQRDLARTGDVVKAKETTIAALKKQIAELRLEHKAIQEAAAKFSIYLKRNSITHYNDATEEYLEHMIKDEKTKARVGTSRARLEMLEKDLQNYQKFVQTMEQGKNRGGSGRALDEGAVVNLIKSLYNLPHYGAMLKDLASVVGRAYEANFRERPYRVSRRRNWSYGDIGSIQNGGWCRPRQPSRSSYTPGKSMIDDAMMGGPKKSPSHSGLFGPVSSKLVSRRRPDSTNAGSFGPTKQEFGTPSSNNPFTSSVSSPVRNDKQPLGEEEEFWPSSSSTEKPQPKVQSISDWDDSLATETQPSRNPFINRENAGGPFSSFRSSRSSIPTAAPPPYRPFDDNGVAQQRGDGMAIVQKKGVWLKVKEKLRKT